MTAEQLAQLRVRMLAHDVVDGRAVVTLTARELQELLDHIAELELRPKPVASFPPSPSEPESR